MKDGFQSGLSASAEGYISDAAAKPVIYGVNYEPGRAGEQSEFGVDYYSSTPVTFNWALTGCDPAESTATSPQVKLLQAAPWGPHP